MNDDLEPTPRPALTAFGVLIYMAVAVIAAVIEVLLIPLRIGTVLFPVTVLFGAATMIALPLLVQQLTPRALPAALPVVAWFFTLAALTTSRPEGDVIVPGGKYVSLSYVFYALAIVGIGAGAVTIVRTDSHRPPRLIRTAPVPSGPSPVSSAPNVSPKRAGSRRPEPPSRPR